MDHIGGASSRLRPDDIVRNPVLALPSLQRLLDLPAHTRAEIEALLRDLAHDARIRAEQSWRTRKAPMAAYWHVIAVYSRHIARAVRPGRRKSSRRRPAAAPEVSKSGATQPPSVVLPFRRGPVP
jgi:hypothetical protein